MIAAAKQSGKQSLEGYEKTLASLLSFGEKVAGATQLDWVSALAKAHATFVTETTAAFTATKTHNPSNWRPTGSWARYPARRF